MTVLEYLGTVTALGWFAIVASFAMVGVLAGRSWGAQSRIDELEAIYELNLGAIRKQGADLETAREMAEAEVEKLELSLTASNENRIELAEKIRVATAELGIHEEASTVTFDRLTAEMEDAEAEKDVANSRLECAHASAERLGVNNLPFRGEPEHPFFRLVDVKRVAVASPCCSAGECEIFYLGDLATDEEVRTRANGRKLRCVKCDSEFTLRHVEGDGVKKALWDRYTPIPKSIECAHRTCDQVFDISYVGLKDYLAFVEWLPGKIFRCSMCDSETLGDEFQHPEA